MSDERPDRPGAPTHQELDEALRRWGSRPPATPAAEAARRLEVRLTKPPPRFLGARRGRRTVRRVAIAATLVLAVALGLILGRPGADRGAGASPDPPPATAPPAPDVLVIDLDDRTTLYMNLARSGPELGSPGAGRPPEGDRS